MACRERPGTRFELSQVHVRTDGLWGRDSLLMTDIYPWVRVAHAGKAGGR